MWYSAGRVPSLRVLPRRLPYNRGKTRKNFSQGKKNLIQVKKNLNHSAVYILPKASTHYKALTNKHITKLTHTHTTKQYKTTTVQIKMKCI
jgi:hypothetical protein